MTRYMTTAVIAGLAGMVALFVVNFFMALGFAPTNEGNEFKIGQLINGSFLATYSWFPMAVTVALASLFVVDTYFDNGKAKKRTRYLVAPAWSVLVGLIGFLIA